MNSTRINRVGPGRRFVGAPLLTLLVLAIGWVALAPMTSPLAATDDDTEIAMRVANLLRAARSVISSNQALINDPAIGDKGLTGEKVLADAIAIYEEADRRGPARQRSGKPRGPASPRPDGRDHAP